MKVALVHDDLVQWGGAERVLAALSEIFPNAPIFTSVFDDKNPILKQNFASKKIITSFIQTIPGWKNLYKALLPLYPIAFEQFCFDEFDVVISQTTRFAKGIITKPSTKHICYCHTPPRFLWNFSGEKVISLLQPYLTFLRFFDRISSRRVDKWIAGSINARNRIKKIYGCDSIVIPPFVDLQKFKEIEPFDGDYLLVVSRLNNYKRVDLVIKVANKLNLSLKIVGTGPEASKLKAIAGPKVEFLGSLDERLLINVLAGCKALVIAGEEDFGLGALETQAMGKPVVAFKKGGVLETIIEGETGYFFTEQSVESLSEALQILDKSMYNQKRCFEQTLNFSKEKFRQKFLSLINP